MKTVGDLLKRTREKKILSLREVSSRTFIQEQYLQAIEHNAFDSLPSLVAAQGFVVTYARFLGLDPAHVNALFRRDYKPENKKTAFFPSFRSSFFEARRQRIRLIAGSLIFVFCIIGGYSLWFYQRMRQPPPLRISSPANESIVRSPVIISGSSVTDALIEVDGLPVGVSQDGEFTAQVELFSGEHVITVVAKNREGNSTTRQVSVRVEE